MINPFKWIQPSLLILCSLFLASCVDVHEEFWLHEDGSAKAEIIIDMPRAATLATGGPKGTKKMAEKMLAEEPTIDSYTVEIAEENKRIQLHVECEVDDLMDGKHSAGSAESNT